jgi:hypothetical protein
MLRPSSTAVHPEKQGEAVPRPYEETEGGFEIRPYEETPRRRGNQVAAVSRTWTPFVFKRSCSSPAWNISRMISQPPTNSPFT